jgi:hypothetical protein
MGFTGRENVNGRQTEQGMVGECEWALQGGRI